MKRTLPAVLVVGALGVAFLLSHAAAPSRESLLPLSRSEQAKGLDRAAGAAFPLSPDQERRIGEGLDRGLAGSPPAPGTPQAALAAGWRELGGTAAGSPLVTRFRGRYAFRTTPEGGVNAFALPGGFVYATEPLLKKLAGDGDALLFVAGHEIGHVELGHCADAYRLRADTDDPLRTVLGGALSVGRLFAQLQFSSAQELEADAYSVRLLRSLRRDPRAGLRVFDALGLTADARTKRGAGEVAVEGMTDYFRTHPGSWERRAALEREIGAAR
jgi:predicted Zn-dependent protease